LFLLAPLAHAERIVSSLTNANITQVSTMLPFWIASPFKTDPTYRFLSSATVGLGMANAAVNVRIFSDNGGQPGSAVADLGTQILAGSTNEFWTFTPASRVLLNPSTTYWVGLGNASTNAFTFSVIMDPTSFSFAAVPGASMTNFTATGSGSGTNPPAQFDSFGTNAVLPFEIDGESTGLAVLTLEVQPGGAKKIISTNGLSYPHIIQAATNLDQSAVWENLGSNTLAPSGAWEFTDLNATNYPSRFYRSTVP
jgi:hypothetical protein